MHLGQGAVFFEAYGVPASQQAAVPNPGDDLRAVRGAGVRGGDDILHSSNRGHHDDGTAAMHKDLGSGVRLPSTAEPGPADDPVRQMRRVVSPGMRGIGGALGGRH